MRSLFALLLLPAACLSAQPALQLEPGVATVCDPWGRANALVHWTSPAPAVIRVVLDGVTGPGGVPMSGPLPAGRGTARAGAWVADGMTFLLTTPEGAELARVRARVICTQPAADSLLPLQQGYEWTYRTRSRQQTGGTLTLRVTSAAEHNGELWFEVRREDGGFHGWFREDAARRILRKDSPQAAPAVWAQRTGQPVAWTGALGHWDDAVEMTESVPLLRTQRLYGPGTGLLLWEQTVIAGSSGGFGEGGELVAYRLGGASREEPGEVSLRVTAESAVLEVSSGLVSNCAVPCYFTACGLVPGADPPGTYKPCFRAAATGRSAMPGAVLTLQLRDGAGAVLYESSQAVAAGERLQRQVPVAHPPGRYELEARISGAGGEVEQRAVMSLTVR